MFEEEITTSSRGDNDYGSIAIPFETKMMEANITIPQYTSAPEVLGPFSFLVCWTGFDLSRSDARKGGRPIAIVTTAICVVMCILFIARTLNLLLGQPQPMTLLWGNTNLMLGLAIYSTAAAISIALWTRSGAFESIQKELGKVKALRVLPNDELDDFRGVHRRGFFTMVFIVGTWCLIAGQDILYSPMNKRDFAMDNNTFEIQYPIKWSSMFGAGPPLMLWMGVTSSVATVVYLLCISHLIREFEYFNQELQKASSEHQLNFPDILAAYGRRHFDLMILLKHANAHLGKFSAVATLGAILVFILAIYIPISYHKDCSIPYLALVTLFNVESVSLLFIIIGAPMQIQEAIYQTKCILLEDDNIPTATDPRVQHFYRMFLNRCDNPSQMFFMNALTIDRVFIYKILMIAPNIGVLMAIIQKLL